jgi:hypothetical protein
MKEAAMRALWRRSALSNVVKLIGLLGRPTKSKRTLVIAVSVGDREPVGEEDQVEFSVLELARDVNVIVCGEKRHLVDEPPGPAPQELDRY